MTERYDAAEANRFMVTIAPHKFAPAGEVISSRAEAMRRISDLIARHNEVVASYAQPQLANTYYGYFKNVGLPALRRGADIRTIYTDAVYSDAIGIAFIRDTLRAGCQARTVTYLPTATCPESMVIGRRIAVLPLSTRGSGDRWSFHYDGDEVGALLGFLEDQWNAAAPVEADPSASTLTPLERRILHQLRNGTKDASAARMLGISVRTYRRHVTALCARLGASSRFEAGVNAVLAGLVQQSGG
jgi:DNA-binding CsgD family transcriptional regulator